MRGKDAIKGMQFEMPGITPAYAGKSMTQTTSLTRSTDHPRLCGEKQKAGA